MSLLLEQLANNHRTAQTEVAAEVALRTLQAWPMLDIQALDATFPGWRDLVQRIINDGRARSSVLAAQYADLVKKVELGPSAQASTTLADVVGFDQVTGNLLLAGPASIKQALRRGTSLNEAVINAQARSAGVAENLALNGGRETLFSDKQVITFARVCSGKPCAFCAMLASRGPVYRSKASAGFQAHPNCHCMPAPSYKRGAGRSQQSKDFLDQYHASTKGLRGKDALNAFRRSFNPQDFT